MKPGTPWDKDPISLADPCISKVYTITMSSTLQDSRCLCRVNE